LNLKTLFIEDMNILSLGSSNFPLFNEIMIELIQEGVLENLEVLGLRNCNLANYLMAKSEVIERRLEFLRMIGERCNLIELDLCNNNLNASQLAEVIIQLKECRSLKTVRFRNQNMKWPLNSKQYQDLQRNLDAAFF